MGNRLGNQRQRDAKTKEEKQKEKTIKKEAKHKKREKATERNKLGQHTLEWDIDIEESSHLSGGDSESCVFHSAENVSVSPYLDSCTRSELEQGMVLSDLSEVCPSVSRHPQILSSKDFRDGFSLEACIPSDIARQDGHTETSSSATWRHERHKSGSVNSKHSNNSMKSFSAYRPRCFTPTTSRSQHGDDASSMGTSSQISGNEEGYSTPLLSTPVYQREEKCHSPTVGSTGVLRAKQADVDNLTDIIPLTSTGSFQQHHFDNIILSQGQTKADFRNLPKPSSPQPQRRKLSPNTSSPFMKASSDDSSSSPTTPVPQRRVAAFLDIFRSGNRSETGKKIKRTEKVTGFEQAAEKTSMKVKEKVKVKSNPLWKTWERSSSKKAGKFGNVSIFGTARKPVQIEQGDHINVKDKGINQKTTIERVSRMKEESLGCDLGCEKKEKENQGRPASPRKKTMFVDNKTSKAGSINVDAHFNTSPRATGEDDDEDSNRNSSPPIIRSAAFCIMKLEELEKAIERTIREKFPDADPLLLKSRSTDYELRGSRSLPTTPSLKKKVYVARKIDGTRCEKQGLIKICNKGTTQYCDEIYESSPSPVMSPVVLRRFGARTRHASISPKIQRAKTATLYSSPMEMSRAHESFATKTVSRVPVYHAVSTQQPQTPVLDSKFVKPLNAAPKSESKYDNVMDEIYAERAQASAVAHLVRQRGVDEDDSDETEESVPFQVKEDNDCQKPVIVPTFSAVFGSVSPKLKRHFETKVNGKNPTDLVMLTDYQTRSDGDCLDLERSPVTKCNPNKTSLPVGLYASHVGIASNPKKLSPGGTLIHDEDKHRASEGLCKQTMTVANINSNQTTFALPDTGSKPISVKVHGEPKNKYQSENSAPSTHYANIISDAVGSSLPHSAGKIHVEKETGAVPYSPDQRNMESGTSSHLPTKQDIGKGIERKANDGATSPGSACKHSSDHVIFGSAIALPCRLYASLPVPETINREHSHIAHAPRTVEKQTENLWNEQKEKADESSEDENLVQHPTSVQQTTNSKRVTTHNVLESVTTERNLYVEGCSVVTNSTKNFTDTFRDRDLLTAEVFSTNTVPSGDKYAALPDIIRREQREHNPTNQEQRPYELIDSVSSHLQDGQNFVLHRQPVSQVISDMINVSKEQRQQNQPKQQRSQRRHHQSNPASPEHGIKLVRTAVAMVTPPSYEQPCLTLEEKTVQSGSSVSSPSPLSEPKFESNSNQKEKKSCSQEIQTDSYTTADKSVDSEGLMLSACPSTPSRQIARAMGTETAENYTGVQVPETDDSDGSDFLKMVLTYKQNSSHGRAEGDNLGKVVSKRVPPPSPTTMQKLIREFDEEGEDDEAHENRETESEMKRELEMKQFTDTIYKRLSDLLGSNQTCAENDLDDDVFEEDSKVSETSRSVHELLSRLERSGESLSSNDDSVSHFTVSSSAVSSGKTLVQAKVLTIETSSSLTTTTSSDSDAFEPPQTFQVLQNSASRMVGEFEDADSVTIRGKKANVFVFPEIHNTLLMKSDDTRHRRSSREYHSDDDVAKGRGIPDYYDDRPLWFRRQKPPGQLSANMMAIRRRERRERWLRKRRRNRTELISTGSSDNGSDFYSHRSDAPVLENRKDRAQADAVHFQKPGEPKEKGCGIFSVPKYSKPILPFFDKSQTQRSDNPDITYLGRHQVSSHYREVDSGSNSDDSKYQQIKHAKDKRKRRCFGDDKDNDGNDHEQVCLDSNIAIPGIEETFSELMSVQNILEEMQDKTPTNETAHLMPLTTENVKSIRDFYRDCYSGGNGRRSRMSATDRTESDLDIYSETRDDASSDSNVYADDEEDDDKFEPYATAEDDLGATGGSSSAPCSKSGDGHHDDHDVDSDTNFVVGCTFYNSKAYPSDAATEFVSNAASNVQTSPPFMSASHTPHDVPNSDEEFWAGGSVIEESYKQLESVADAVSSTFQNAREQMHDIQHHLQDLRRQMEVLQDDLICTSITMTPDMSMGSTGKK